MNAYLVNTQEQVINKVVKEKKLKNQRKMTPQKFRTKTNPQK